MRKISTSAYTPTEIEVQSISDKEAKIIAYPFETGYGVTLAHPLRRLLYSSTLGYAAIAVKIKGVSHEFDSMRGMLEDVALFIINLKQIRFKLKNDSERAVLEYNFKGSKEIRGIDLNSDVVEIVNPDAYLATLNEDAELNFSVVLQKGIGYVPSEEIHENFGEGYIVLDAFFTPVKKAVYEIENVLVEDNPDFEKIIFTIVTDGQVGPIQAFKHSLEAMQKQMSVFQGILEIDLSKPNALINQNQSSHSKLFAGIEDLNLSSRSFNGLNKADIRFIGELALMDEAEFKKIKNLGDKSLSEIRQTMEEIGYPIGSEELNDQKEDLKNKIAELKELKEDK